MKYYLLPSDDKLKAESTYPCIVLRRDNWDDFGFKTTIYLEYFPSEESRSKLLGTTKILKYGQEQGYTDLPKEFDTLSNLFCSLGQEDLYYKKIHEEGLDRVLGDLRDVAYKDKYLVRFIDQPGYSLSLLRFGRADKLIEEARLIFEGGEVTSPGEDIDNSFEYTTYIPSSNEKIKLNFDFYPDDVLPFRTNVMVGENGTGKSIIISKLAVSISGIGRKQKDESVLKTKEKSRFSDVIVLSYSPFDSFKDVLELNDGKVSKSSVEREFLPYTFLGIRKLKKSPKGDPVIILKSHRTQRLELKRSFRKAIDLNRLTFLDTIIEDTFLNKLIEPSVSNLINIYENLSSGQKIVLKIIVDLIGHVKKNNLILFDEPENYLHPQGISDFYHAINRILNEFDAYSIIATHSPVIVQETPSKYVTILKKRGFNVKAFRPETETLGQSLNSIINESFRLSLEGKRFYAVFDKYLEQGLGIDEIEDKLGNKLSLNASSYFLSKDS